MLILNSSEKIQIRLVAAVATSQLDVICNYIDRTIASTATAELQTDVVTNDANAVDIIPAPAGTEKRLVKEISVYNADTASATVIIQRVTAGGTRIEIRVTLDTLEKLGYEDSRGWYVMDVIGTASALTKTDDTNVTLTLGGTPATALLQATSIAVGWAGQLSVARGGTGVNTIAALSIWLANAIDTITSVTPAALQSIRINAANTAWEVFTPGIGNGDALVANPLSQFAATTSLQLLGVISDETGTGLLVFNNSPVFVDDITIGTVAVATGQILLSGLTSGTVTLSVLDAAGTWTMKLPNTGGNANEFLQTDGAGNTTWAAGGGGITIGTTAITNGTTTNILYNNAGVAGEYTLTGTGTVVAMQTAPTFVTSIISPLVIGGTGTTQTLTYKTTSGVGATGARHIFQVGNNGATEAMTILNNGFVGIGVSPTRFVDISGASSASTGEGITLRITDTRTTGDFRHPALTLVNNNLTGNIVAMSQNIYSPFDSLNGFYIMSRTSNIPLYFTTNNAGTEIKAMTILGNGNLGIGTASPTAVLHLKASTATANTASLKIDAGTVATTPVSGNIESDGTNLYWTDSGGTRRQLNN